MFTPILKQLLTPVVRNIFDTYGSKGSKMFSPVDLFTTGVNGAWYDPSDLTTLYQDAAGTIPVTAVEQPVGLMKDKSGRNNHAFNPSGNSANFPVLSARYNLLTKTELLTDAAWTKTAGVTVTDNAAVAPDGTTTATTIAFGTLGREIAQIFSATNAITAQTFYVKGTAGQVLNFGAAGQNRSITLTGGWDLASSTLPAGITKFYIGNYEANALLNISVWHPDLRVANDALNQPTYQRVNTATDYDTVGFKPYLRFNGTNQWLQTNSIDLTYTDKMFVSAGVRKLSDGNFPVIVETWKAVASTFDSFTLHGSQSSTLTGYVAGITTTATSFRAGVTGNKAAPITDVVSVTCNSKATTLANTIQLRINTSSQTLADISSAGIVTTNNFGSNPLFIGAREGSSLWFNGRLYQMVFAGKQASAAEITSTETYLNQKTGAY